MQMLCLLFLNTHCRFVHPEEIHWFPGDMINQERLQHLG